MHKFFEGVEHTLERKDGEIIITVKGSKEKLDVIEKKLKALKELCCCCGDNDDCC